MCAHVCMHARQYVSALGRCKSTSEARLHMHIVCVCVNPCVWMIALFKCSEWCLHAISADCVVGEGERREVRTVFSWRSTLRLLCVCVCVEIKCCIQVSEGIALLCPFISVALH